MQQPHDLSSSHCHNHKVFYWQGLLDPRGLSQNYQAVIEQLVNGNYQSLKLEKLSGHNVYSVRVNHSNRLLFTCIEVNHQLYLMLLDEVLNHRYDKSRFLKPAVFRHYLEFQGKSLGT